MYHEYFKEVLALNHKEQLNFLNILIKMLENPLTHRGLSHWFFIMNFYCCKVEQVTHTNASYIIYSLYNFACVLISIAALRCMIFVLSVLITDKALIDTKNMYINGARDNLYCTNTNILKPTFVADYQNNWKQTFITEYTFHEAL